MSAAFKEINLMVDIETLGTKPGCGILSIAVVPFQAFGLPSPIENFYVRILPDSNIRAGLKVDDATLEWWETKSPEAREEAFSGTTHLSVALNDLEEYMAIMPKGTLIWGKGAAFDVPILEAAYEAFRHPAPWTYKQSMCFRTLEALYPQVPAPQGNKLKHSALSDAIYQAAHAQRILEWLTRM